MKIKIILGIIFFIMILQTLSATNVIIIMKDSYGLGEKVSFDYSISGTGEQISYVTSVNCPEAPTPLLELKNGTTPLSGNYEYLSSVTENIKPQTCNAIVSIMEPYRLDINKTFQIIMNPSFKFNTLLCNDASLCSKDSNVFVKGENVNIKYDSEIPGLIVSAILTSPEGISRQISLPISLLAEQIGTYQIDVSASKSGYQTQTQTVQFGVISKEANVESSSGNNVNDDSDLIKAHTQSKNWIIFWISIFALIVIFAGILILKILNKKN